MGQAWTFVTATTVARLPNKPEQNAETENSARPRPLHRQTKRWYENPVGLRFRQRRQNRAHRVFRSGNRSIRILKASSGSMANRSKWVSSKKGSPVGRSNPNGESCSRTILIDGATDRRAPTFTIRSEPVFQIRFLQAHWHPRRGG